MSGLMGELGDIARTSASAIASSSSAQPWPEGPVRVVPLGSLLVSDGEYLIELGGAVGAPGRRVKVSSDLADFYRAQDPRRIVTPDPRTLSRLVLRALCRAGLVALYRADVQLAELDLVPVPRAVFSIVDAGDRAGRCRVIAGHIVFELSDLAGRLLTRIDGRSTLADLGAGVVSATAAETDVVAAALELLDALIVTRAAAIARWAHPA